MIQRLLQENFQIHVFSAFSHFSGVLCDMVVPFVICGGFGDGIVDDTDTISSLSGLSHACRTPVPKML
jgi:hypothetical protein